MRITKPTGGSIRPDVQDHIRKLQQTTAVFNLLFESREVSSDTSRGQGTPHPVS